MTSDEDEELIHLLETEKYLAEGWCVEINCPLIKREHKMTDPGCVCAEDETPQRTDRLEVNWRVEEWLDANWEEE